MEAAFALRVGWLEPARAKPADRVHRHHWAVGPRSSYWSAGVACRPPLTDGASSSCRTLAGFTASRSARRRSRANLSRPGPADSVCCRSRPAVVLGKRFVPLGGIARQLVAHAAQYSPGSVLMRHGPSAEAAPVDLVIRRIPPSRWKHGVALPRREFARSLLQPGADLLGGKAEARTMTPHRSETDLDDLPEPTRSRALELLWLLREGGHAEHAALELARRGAQAEAVRLREVARSRTGAD